MNGLLGGPSLYTVEQLELIRRLRNSGITKDDIIAAFDSYDRLERELGPVYNIPVTLALQAQALQLMALGIAGGGNSASNNNNHVPSAIGNIQPANQSYTAPTNNLQFPSLNNITALNNFQIPAVNSIVNNAPNTLNNQSVPVSLSNAGLLASLANLSSPNTNNNINQNTLQTPVTMSLPIFILPASSVSQPSAVQPELRRLSLEGMKTEGGVGGVLYGDGNSVGGGGSGAGPVTGGVTNDMLELAASILKNGGGGVHEEDIDAQEFAEFISLGEEACCEEIRGFVVKHNIKQQQIATLAGICQSYVSKYMKGDVNEMSERSRRAIQKWYVVYRKNPASIAYAANASMLMSASNSSSTNQGGGGMSIPTAFRAPSSFDVSEFVSSALEGGGVDSNFARRERFVFRPKHLEILEKYFQDNNYPSYETRDEMARACNQVSETLSGRELADREKVSGQIIANWFANKRKELKKLARDEGLLDVSSAPLRPRGHPSRLYSELAVIQQCRGGGTGGGVGGEVSSSSGVTAGGLSPDGSPPRDEYLSDSDHQVTGSMSDSLPPDSSTTSTAAAALPLHQYMEDLDDSSHWSVVELAAVNQAIYSLTGQQPIDVSNRGAVNPAIYSLTGQQPVDVANRAAVSQTILSLLGQQQPMDITNGGASSQAILGLLGQQQQPIDVTNRGASSQAVPGLVGGSHDLLNGEGPVSTKWDAGIENGAHLSILDTPTLSTE